MAITPGPYALLSYLDPKVRIDVTGESVSQGANVELWTENAGTANNQLFEIPAADGSGYVYIQSPQTGYVLDAEWTGSTPVSGNNIVMWGYHGGVNQLFKPVQDGTTTYNGSTVPVYRFQSKANGTLYLDACGGKSYAGTNVWLWEYLAWQDGQKWIPVKTSAYASTLPAPSDLALLMPDGTECRNVAGAQGSTTVYPTFTSAASMHQMRYRYRARSGAQPDAYRSAWSPWASIADGSTTDDGWGDAWADNCATSMVNGRHTCTSGITFDMDGSTLDLLEIQIEVRAFDDNWGLVGTLAHGSSCTRTLTVARLPNVSIAGVAFAPDGLRVSYASDFLRANNRTSDIVEASDGVLAPVSVEVYQPATGYVFTPFELLSRVPEESEPVTASLALTTTDGVTAYVVDAGQTVSYTDGTMAFNATVTFDAQARTCAVTTDVVGSEVRAWVEASNGFLPVEDFAHIPYPLGADWHLWVLCYVDELNWAVKAIPYTAEKPDGFRWNWEDAHGFQRYCRIRCGEGDAPTADVKTTIDAEFSRTYGREWEVAHIGKAKERTISVDGVILDSDAGDAERFEGLIDARFAWFRDGGGNVWRTGVTETAVNATPYGWRTASAECKVVSA